MNIMSKTKINRGGGGVKSKLTNHNAVVLLVFLSFMFNSCKACNEESKYPEPENGTVVEPIEEPDSTDGSKGSPEPENGTVAKPVEEPNNSSDANSTDGSKGSPGGASSAKPDDKKTEADVVVAEARRLALAAKAEAQKAYVAGGGIPGDAKVATNDEEATTNWDTYMGEYDRRIQEATQAKVRAEALEAQAIELNSQRNPQRNPIVIERVARTTTWARYARYRVAYLEMQKAKAKILGKKEPHDQCKIRVLTGKQIKQWIKSPSAIANEEAHKADEAAVRTWKDADKARADAGHGHEDGDSDVGVRW
jgi:hypothetical protein